MQDTKKWYESKGVWGSVAVVAATVGQIMGYDVDSVTLTGLFEQTLAWVLQGLQIGGAALAFWGRITASKSIE